METRIDRRRVHTGRLLTVDVDRVRLDDGTAAEREVVHHPGAVVVIAVLGDGRVVLERQFRYAVGEELLELPAGTLHPGEDPEDCARRELEEETGYRAGALTHLVSYFSAPGFCDERMHCFLAEELAVGQARPDEDERLELVLEPLARACEMARSGVIRDAKSIAGLLLAESLLAGR